MPAEKKKRISVSLVTPVAVLSYPHLDAPQEADTGPSKYTATLIFTPEVLRSKEGAVRFAALEEAVGQVAEEFFGKMVTMGNTKVPVREALAAGALHNPFRRDTAKKGYPAGSVFINAKTEQQPGMVRADLSRVPAEEVRALFYPGCHVRASVVPFAFDNKLSGVSFGLNNLQWLSDGERLDSRVAAEDEFSAVESADAPPQFSQNSTLTLVGSLL